MIFLLSLNETSPTNDSLLQSISTLSIPVLTAVLVGVTIWYAWKTQIMARIMEKQYNLAVIPYISIENDIKVNWNLIQPTPKDGNYLYKVSICFLLKNIGTVPLSYTLINIFNNQTTNIPEAQILFPGQERLFQTPEYSIETEIKEKLDGESIISIHYWALDIHERKYFYKRTSQFQDGTCIIKNEDTGLCKV